MGAGPSEYRRGVRQVNNSKEGKKEAEISILKEINAIDSGMDLELELGKE